MKYIGAHVGIDGGVENAPLYANEIGARAFALFTKPERQWFATPLSKESIDLFKERCEQFGYKAAHILPHDSFLINLGHPEKTALARSRASFLGEMRRCEELGLDRLNFHPGSGLKKISEEACMNLIAESINVTLDRTRGVCAVIENTAGQGANVGYTFEQLAYIIDRVEDKERVGVCIDTCHAFAAGYDFRTEEGYEEVFRLFGETVGFRYLKGMHLNDTKKGLGSRVDRHENIGEGELGIETFSRIMQDSRFDDLPLILETPDSDRLVEAIEKLYRL